MRKRSGGERNRRPINEICEGRARGEYRGGEVGGKDTSEGILCIDGFERPDAWARFIGAWKFTRRQSFW